jgi:protocatechuate 3,4-dioxygenase beta subunit
MKKLTLPLMLGLITVTACIYFVWIPSVPIVDTQGESPTDYASSGDSSSRRDNRNPIRGDSSPDRGSNPGRQRTNLRSITVSGRCLDARTRAPIPGCEVEVGTPLRGLSRKRLRVDPVRAFGQSEADGRFKIQIQATTEHPLELHTQSPGYADMEGPLAGSGTSRSVGDILIPKGALLRGHVEDKTGGPQPAVALRFFRQVNEQQSKIHPTNWFKLTSDETGALVSNRRLACQTWSLTPADEGLRVIKPAGNFQITQGQASQYLTVVVELPDPKALIRGQIIDEEGKPIAHTVSIQALAKGSWPVGYGYSKADGSFTVRCRKQPDDPVHLAIPQGHGYEKMISSTTFRWATQGVQLVLEATSGTQITVVRSSDGQPVENYQALWHQVYKPGERSAQQRSAPASHHPDGKMVLHDIPRGPTRLIVIPTDPGLAPNKPVEFVKASDQQEIEVRIPQRIALQVHVTNPSGQPVVGTKLELLQSEEGNPITASTRAVDHQKFSQLAYRSINKVMKLDEGQTDSNGLVSLRWSAAQRPLTVRVLGPGHIPLVLGGILLSADSATLELVVQTGGTLIGQLQPINVLKQLTANSGDSRWQGLGPRIVLNPIGTTNINKRDFPKTPVQPDGSFQFDDLITGTWEVRFTTTRFTNGRGASIGEKILGQIDMTHGGVKRVSYDIGHLRPANLQGRVFVNGTLATQTDIQLTLLDPTQGRQSGASQLLQTDDNGNFYAKSISPGRYTLSVKAPGADRWRRKLASSTTILVPPGSDLLEDFYVQAGALRVQIQHPDGSPVANQYFQVTGKTANNVMTEQSNSEGVLVIDPLATGEYVIKIMRKGVTPQKGPGNPFGVMRRGQLIDIGKVSVVAGNNPPTLLITLPAK